MNIKEIKEFYLGKTVAVTGSAGFVGHHLVDALVSNGCKVRALVKYNSQSDIGLLKLLDPKVLNNVEIVFADVRDLRAMEQFVKGTDLVFHLAALIGIPYSYVAPGEYVSINTKGTMNMLEAVRRFKTTRLVITSTSETYGSAQYTPMDEKHPLVAQSPYAASKIAADQLALSYHRSFNTPVTVIRPFNIFGPGQSLRAVIPTIILQMLQKKPVIKIGSKFPVRDFTYVKDTVDGFVRMGCAKKVEGDVFSIATGVGFSIGEIVDILKELTGYKGKIVTEEKRKRPTKSEVVKLIGSFQKAQKALGWTPKVSFKEGLKLVIADFKKTMRDRDVSKYTV